MQDPLLSQTRWLAAQPPMAFQLPSAQVRNVLLDAGSLTRRLQRESHHRLQVRILREGPTRPSLPEAQALGLNPRQLAWGREILLCAGDTPWVRARTLFPLAPAQGESGRFRQLGEKPLGLVLFQEPGWQRSAFRIGRVRNPDSPGSTWARRSSFQRGPDRLLITEWFFPAYWAQTAATPPDHSDRTRESRSSDCLLSEAPL
ncbi:chorismate lyase [Marinobacteraceae bacterium S3BR75-40.1]